VARELLILAVGRLKDPLLERASADYFKRCRGRFAGKVREVKTLARLKAAVPGDATLVCLDPRGRAESSERFARRLETWLQIPSRPVVFAIGGADGLDQELRDRAHHVMSLGPMTLAHRLARLVLTEQLYRAVSILEGSPYHRG